MTHIVVAHPENSPEEINIYLRPSLEEAEALAAQINRLFENMRAHVYVPRHGADRRVLAQLAIEYECNYGEEEYK